MFHSMKICVFTVWLMWGVALWSLLVPDKAFVLIQEFKFIPPINAMTGNQMCWPVSRTKGINCVFLLCNSIINVVINIKCSLPHISSSKRSPTLLSYQPF